MWNLIYFDNPEFLVYLLQDLKEIHVETTLGHLSWSQEGLTIYRKETIEKEGKFVLSVITDVAFTYFYSASTSEPKCKVITTSCAHPAE